MASLVAACNQTTNREPVVTYDESTVKSGTDELKQLRLIRSVLPSHGRSVVRYRHVLDETLALDTRQCALLAVILLRGPQTIGELRIRTDRMTEFDGLDEVEHELAYMSSLTEPLTANLGRRPGQKEERWVSPLVASSTGEPSAPGSSIPSGGASPADRVDALYSEVALLRSEVSQLRDDLHALRESLGD
jgi:hypothetical protein